MESSKQERIYELLAKKLSENATLDELRELESLLALRPDFKRLHDSLQDYPRINDALSKDLTDQAYAAQFVKMMYAEDDPKVVATWLEETDLVAQKRRIWNLKSWRVAAVLLILIIAATTFYLLNGNELVGTIGLMSDVEKKSSSKSKLTLPDGTTVYLNTNSYLQYGADFNKKNREVSLVGEAYFDVAQDSIKPFIVRTSKATIKVIGTRFNIKNYENDIWEATLLQGKIEMYLNNRPKDKLQLEPSQKVSIVEENAPAKYKRSKEGDFKVLISKINQQSSEIAEIAWMDNKLVFFDEPLYKIAKELERSFGITVKIISSQRAEQRYTGSFKNDNLEQILKILNMSNPINYEWNRKELIIK